MALTPGTRLGVYEVTASIGEGGMGQVYRAHDTQLNRDVALKVLPDLFASDPDRLARFTREAQTLAALNHPNIAHIHGLEESGGVRALVMELVEGEDLSQRIARGAIPIDEALPIAKQIAEALEAAHEQGIIHRDLKPANIKVRNDGTVKVLDFGLAKALEPTGAMAVSNSMSPTITTPAMMTGVGMILGTAAYMSPEQARGKTVDKRADIWAFGCVLFEMLTGARAFAGDDMSDVLASVLKTDPDWTVLPGETPTSLRKLLRRCLEKDRQRRLADMHDARLEIDDALAGMPEPQPMTPTSSRAMRRERLVWLALVAASLVLTGTLLTLRVWSPQPASPARLVMRLELSLPTGVEFYAGYAQTVAVSLDGTRVAFIGVLGGVRQLYLRRLDQVEATPLRGTETASACFFSPDRQAVGFVTADARLKKVSLADGLVVPLALDADVGGGGVWGSDDRLTFARAGALWQVPAAGGAATAVTRVDTGKGELSHQWPTVVADGKVLLFTVVTGSGRGAAHIEALTLATGQRQVLVDPGLRPLYALTGHLIFFRDDALLAAAFDVDRLAVTGPPIRVVENFAVDTRGAPVAALTPTGALVYPPGGLATSQVVWVSRQGLEQPLTDTPRPYTNPRLAPGGQHVLVSASGDLWIQDTARATFTRLTSNETSGNSFPVWTPDGTRAVFRTRADLHWIDADGSGRSQAIPGTSVNDYPNSVSPDGATLAFTRLTANTSGDVYVLSLKGDPQPQALVKGPAYEGGAQFSPDGHWLAYTSDESGAFQVYVRPFPGPDRRWPVSTQGGTHARWNRNGKELFYRNGNKMMVVDVSTSPALVLSPPRLLFERRYAFGSSVTTPNYDVSADGQRFVMVKDESGSGRLNVVLNWFDELKARVPTTK